MIRIELSSIFEKMGAVNKLALEEAASICISRQNKEVSIVHLLYALVDIPLCDFRIMLKQLDFDHETVKQQLANFLPQDQGLDSYPVFSPLLIDALQDTWLLSSTELGQANIRSGAFFLIVLLQSERYLPYELISVFKTINREAYRTNFNVLLNESIEAPVLEEVSGKTQPSIMGNSFLEKYTTNYTQQAINGELDPVLSRDKEINLMIDILCRRRKNNPIVVGDAGVGKSALIEGIAQKIVDEKVPEKLFGVSLLSLDLGLLQAGASVKGEFEKRLKGIIDEVKTSVKPIILFIDEAHTLIGAGNQEGGGDAANLLKPALARGELRTIAATTWKEYKKYFEKDPALTRRFQLVPLDEPSVEQTVNILRGLHSVYEQSHQVLITDEALKAAAQLSARYVSGRQLPDKAIDVLDTACARIAINLSVPPIELTALQDSLYQINLERDLIKREIKIGNTNNQERFAELEAMEKSCHEEISALQIKWEYQKNLVREVIELRSALLDSVDEEVNDLETSQLLNIKETELKSISKNDLLVHSRVDAQQIASVVSDWTGIPINQMDRDELVKITDMPIYLGEAIKGQSIAISKIHQYMLTSRADLRRAGRPKGSFLLVGPSGVGKTETVIQIAELLYGGKQFLTVINMSEYQEKHTVSRLLGAPPGYVGYGEGGVLTEAIRQKPYSVVLLDEVEKAHPEVLNVFYQAFDKGDIADGEGRVIDCQNIIFFLTSNLGYQTIVDHYDDPTALNELLYPELSDFFKPALLARMEIVPYLPLGDEVLKDIIRYKLSSLEKLLKERYQTTVDISQELVDEIQKRATRTENGARMLESIIDGQLLPPLSLVVLNKMAHHEKINHICLTVVEGEFVCHVDRSCFFTNYSTIKNG